VSETLRYLESDSARNGIDVVTLVKCVLMDAVAAKASDIHIEPWESTLAVRLRLNGVLTELVHLRLDLMEKISGRFKVLGNMVT
jgi:type II secretory ATPase GspE/PulE/Tfp pilus assembly ATPase PilB-like protein